MYQSTTLLFVLAAVLPLTINAAPTPTELDTRSSNGPVITTNFQDPCLTQVGNTWYAFSGPNGNPANINVQMAQSPDFATWTVAAGKEVLPDPGVWANKTAHVWSPDVNQLADGSFIMYYAASSAQSPKMHCIGAATSKTIAGPYIPQSAPMFCNLTAGGAIDADGFVDPISKNRYIVYKVDGNSIGHGGACMNSVAPIAPTPIRLQQVQADGFTKIGTPVTILNNDPEDGPNVEAPALLYDGASKQYILIYNSNCFTEANYAVRWASSPNLLGPYTKQPTPLLVTGSTAANVQIPGAVDVSPSGTMFVFHGDMNPSRTPGTRVRAMYAAKLNVASGGISFGGLS